MTLPSFLTGGLLWKIGTGAAAIAVIVLTILLISANRETADLLVQRNELAAQINDPQTGFVARLAQSRTNEAQLQVAIERQTVLMRQKAEEDARILESTRQQLVVANRKAADAERRAQRFVATPPQGNTLEERVRDVDGRIMEELNRGQ